MKSQAACAILVSLLAAGCGQPASDDVAQQRIDAESKRVEANFDMWEAQSRQTDAQLKRFDKMLDKWDEQAKRYDALLDKWEKQNPTPSSAPPAGNVTGPKASEKQEK